MTAVTLLKRMANFIEETARYLAPSKAIDTLAVNITTTNLQCNWVL